MTCRLHLRQALWLYQQIVWIAFCRQALAFFPYFLLLRHASSLTSRLISKPFVHCAAQQFVCALSIVHAEFNAVVITKIELCKVAV